MGRLEYTELERLRREIELLAARLATVEQELSVRRAPAAPDAAPTPPHAPVLTQTAPRRPLGSRPAPWWEDPPAEARSPEVTPPVTPPIAVESLAAVVEVSPQRPAAAVSVKAREAVSIERLVGGRYFLAAGAIVVVIGVGLFLKLGYDMGWFRMSAAWKCIWGALFGLGMIGAGEAARRKISVMASIGLSAAGLGSLYLSTYAAHGLYGLLGPEGAFVFLSLVVALGIAIAVVARQAGVAVLALLGGYLAPFLLDVDQPSPAVVPFHALALLVTGLSLAGWRPGVFGVLRAITWWGTVVLGTIWLVSQGVEHPGVALPFVALVWAAVHAELILSVRGEYESDAPSDESLTILLRWRNVRPIATSLCTSVWCVVGGVFTLRTSPILPDWLIPAGAAVAAILLSGALAGHLRVLRDSPRTDAQRLGAGLAMQAGALVVATIAFAFSGSMEVLAWLALGVAAAGTAAWLRAPSLGAYALVPLLIGAGRLLFYDSWISRAGFTPLPLGALVVDRWTLLMLMGGVSWIASCLLFLRLRDDARRALIQEPGWGGLFLNAAPVVCLVGALVLIMGAFLHPQNTVGAIASVWTAVGALVGLAYRWERRLDLASAAFGVLWIATIAWGNAFLSRGWSHDVGTALIHPGAMTAGLLVLAVGGLATWFRSMRVSQPRLSAHWTVGIVWALALAWVTISLEVYRLAARIEIGPRAAWGSLSVWWTLAGAAMLIVGFRRDAAALRVAGSASIGVSLVAWLLAFVVRGWEASSANLVLHPGFVVAATIVAIIAVLVRRWRAALREPASDRGAVIVGLLVAALSLGWLATSFEVHRLSGWIDPERTGIGAAGASLSAWWTAWAVVLVAIGYARGARPLRIAAASAALFAIVAWLASFFVPGWTSTGSGWIIHPGFFSSVLMITALGVVAGRFHAHPEATGHPDRLAMLAVATVAITLAWTSTSLETFRLAEALQSGKKAQHAAVSVWWGLFAAGLLAAGFRWRTPPLRYAGLALLGFATLKALVVDLADASAGWRVVSVLGLGMLMLGVALVYVRTSARLAPPPSDEPPRPDSSVLP